MSVISTTTEKTSGDGFDFSSNNQALVVLANVYLIADTGNGVENASPNTLCKTFNYGTIIGHAGIVMSDSGQLFNYAGASIFGDANGVAASGTADIVYNAGQIFGVEGLRTLNSGLALTNDGQIHGSSDGLLLYGAAAKVHNTGVIESSNNGINLASDNASLNLVNDGTITGNAAAITSETDAGAVVLKNTGTISGDIVLGDAANKVTNTGSIVGDISLGNGGSTFNGRGGAVSGTIFGGTGADKLVAGNDGETLAGGGGHDTMVGGTGADTFAFSSFQPADTDIIHLFNVAEDTIQLDHTVFTKLAPDVTPVFAIGTAATSAADHLFYNSATGALSYDVDGNGAAGTPRVIATLDTGLTLTAHNLTVV